MLSPGLRYRLHTLAGCVVYPALAGVMVISSFSAINTKAVQAGVSVCRSHANTACFASQLIIYLAVALFFSVGALVAWKDLLSGRRVPDTEGHGLPSLCRSPWLVRQGWFALPVLAVALLAIGVINFLYASDGA